MSRSDVLHNRQFLNQEVLRTITLGLAPFIPFSQQYVMSVKSTGEKFEMLPDPPAERGKQDVPNSWGQRKQDYFEQPGQSPDEILDKSPRTNVREVSKRLKLLFEKNLGETPTARKFEQSVVGEILSTIGAQEVDTLLNQMGTPIQKGIDGSALFKNPSVGGKGFDREMTDSLRTVMSAAMGGKDLSNVVAIEETESKTMKEIQINLKNKSGDAAISQFKKNVEDVYGNFNKLLRGLKINNSSQLKSTLLKAHGNPYYAVGAYNKQMLARALDLVNSGLGGKEYMYTVPLGNTGMAGTVFIKTIIKGKSPQISYTLNIAETGGHGRLIELMALGLSKLNSTVGSAFMQNIPAMDLIAMNEAVLTADRVGFIGQMQEVTLSTMLTAGADITMSKKKGKGVMGLAPQAMAESLSKQIKQSLTDPKTKNDFTKAYLQLIADANKASEKWKKAVAPPVEFQGAEGVWKQSGDNWDKQGGEDFSVSPFLIMRRAGVKSFEPKMKSTFL